MNLIKEQVLQTLENYEKIIDRVSEVVDEIGFTDTEFNKLDESETEFGKDTVYVTAYDSHYDLYDSRSSSFPLDFLFEDEKQHKDWYKNKQERAKKAGEQAEEKRQKEQELAELQRLKEKYEK